MRSTPRIRGSSRITREPASLVLLRDPLGDRATVDLGGASVYDTGHELFHRDTGVGIACASCHVEGTEDGRVWQFDPIGPRRTQSVDAKLSGTAPFHWDGDQQDFSHLMDEVMVRRMGGAPDRTGGKRRSNWVVAEAVPLRSAASSPAAVRGQTLFDSQLLGCSGCHSGPSMTNNLSAFVGTTANSAPLQVAALHGVGFRAPFLHDGRASTLEARFDPALGGADAHGRTSTLSSSQTADVVAYLKSL